MAGFDYNKMKATADRLIDRFTQGFIEYEAVITVPPTNPWDEPTESIVREEIKGVVSGVAQEFVDGVTVLASDLMLMSTSDVPVGGRIIVDGKYHIIINHTKLPSAGTIVAHRYIIR